MKMMVKLAVLMGALLLLTGLAFSQSTNGLDCVCYSITCTNLDIDMVVQDHPVVLCFDRDNDQGLFRGLCDSRGEMSLFFDAMNTQALAYSDTNPYGYLKFHGDDLHVVTGIGYCAGYGWKMRGFKVDDEFCPHPLWPDED
jgi:hypothetical protein